MMYTTHLTSGQMHGMRFFPRRQNDPTLLSLEKSWSMVKFCICHREAEQEQWWGRGDKTQFPIDRLALLRTDADGAFSLKSPTPSLIGIVFARHFDKCHSVSSEMSGCQHLSRIAHQQDRSQETQRVTSFLKYAGRDMMISVA